MNKKNIKALKELGWETNGLFCKCVLTDKYDEGNHPPTCNEWSIYI